jgi:NAD(P)-dependent dehydrogenase (short-subunit alcohol dehydrogenase family)
VRGKPCVVNSLIPELREHIEKEEKFINILVNSTPTMSAYRPILTTDHGISTGAADITACEQTPEGLSKQMFDGEEMETWLECFKINTASYFFTSFAFLPLLAAAKTVGGYPEPGNIINLASMSGITKTSQRGQFNYNAGKAATISLSHQLATEFARRNLGIRVNVVCPGYFPSVSRTSDCPGYFSQADG